MKKRILYIIIILICISLSGIIAVQFLWIRNAMHVREAQFSRSVNEALGVTVSALETKENVSYISQKFNGDSLRTVFQAFAKDTLISWKPKLDSLLAFEAINAPPPGPRPVARRPHMPPPHPMFFTYNLSTSYDLQKMAMHADSAAREFDNEMSHNILPDEQFTFWNDDDIRAIDSMIVRQKIIFNDHFMQYNVDVGTPAPVVVYAEDHPGQKSVKVKVVGPPLPHRNAGTIKTLKDQINKLNRKADKVQNVIKKMTMELEADPRPITERLNNAEINKVLCKALADKDIVIPFEFAVLSKEPGTDSLPVKSTGFKPEYLSTPYRVSLFPNDIFQKQNSLLIYFPGRFSQLMTSLSWLMIASILFTLIIVLTSGMSIFVMIRQKKISDIKTDFINNMTHEFKTPLATISLAVDSIINPKVIEQPALIRNYTRVIKEENNRMNGRVEQVLQMALLDSKDFKLNETAIDVNGLVENVCNRFHLQVEESKGQLNMQLDADKPLISGDTAHLSNVLMTLLDNAIKYAAGNPDITVSTLNRARSVIISVEDKGIGMSKETRQRVFDKFFRVTSGNIHSVKGFGLGLSYAKAIITAHRGEITVASEPGEGSRFEITLPVVSGDHET